MTRSDAERASRGIGGARPSPLAIGLGALFATLLIYAGAVTPFLRYDDITNFVSNFAHVSLASLLACSCCFVVAMVRGRTLRTSLLLGAGSILYLLSATAFCMLALSGSSDPLPLYLGSIACGVGDCCLCLAWGRIFRRFSLGDALLNVSIACLVAAAVYGVIARVSPLLGVGLFMTCAAVAVVAGFLAQGGADASGKAQVAGAEIGAEGGPEDGGAAQRPDAKTVDVPTTLKALSSFADVVAKPALGLLVFSFVMGLTCKVFVDVFDTYLAASGIAAGTLAVLALIKMRRPLTRLLYRDLLPLLAITSLAAPNIIVALLGPSSVTMFFTLLLYTFAAFLTVATLCAIANASEFSSDFIFATALVLFSVASLAGLLCSQLPASMVDVVVTVVTSAYAFLLVVLRDPASSAQRLEQDSADPAENGRRRGAGHDGGLASQRCAALAREHDLTARESEILGYLAEGHSGAYISDVLFISPNTVRTHIHNIYRKLGASSREDILRMAKE